MIFILQAIGHPVLRKYAYSNFIIEFQNKMLTGPGLRTPQHLVQWGTPGVRGPHSQLPDWLERYDVNLGPPKGSLAGGLKIS